MNNEQQQHIDYIFKFILIGNGNSGKTSLLYRFVHNKQIENPVQTVAVEFSSKLIEVCQKSIKLQLWDTAGQERYRSIAKTYYRGALGAIILYDITNLESFQALEMWIKDAREIGKPDIQIIVVGNKVDLFDQRVKGPNFRSNKILQIIEVTGENVEWTMQLLSQKLLDRIERGLLDKETLKPKFHLIKKEEQQEVPSNSCQC